jgi:hypothetical protein
MTPGTGKFFPANNYHVHLFNDSYEFMNSENSNDTHFGDIVIRLRDWDDQQPPFQIMIDAADEIERLRADNHHWKRVADLFGKAYTTDESGKFAISNGSDLFRAVMAYERALRDERNEFPGETSGNLAPPR